MALSLSTQPEPLLNSDKALLSQSTSPSPSPASSAAIAPKIPATFDRWFWSPDYRRGVTTLFNKLKAGLRESEELIAFVRKRAAHERTYAHGLRASVSASLDPNGFGFDDGASFASAYHQLRSSQLDLSDAHDKLALQLDRLVIGPFETWSLQHELRITSSFNQVETILNQWEKQAAEVAKLKDRYDQKHREADDAEEDSRFSPAALRRDSSRDNSPDDDDRTLIPQSGIPAGEGYAQIGKKVGEQAIGLGRAVSQRMRIGGGRVGFRALAIQPNSTDSEYKLGTIEDSKNPQELDSEQPIDTPALDQKSLPSPSSDETPPTPSAEEKGKGKAHDDLSVLSIEHQRKKAAVNRSSMPLTLSHAPLLNIAGAVKSPLEWSRLFEKARDTVYKQNVKIPLLGTYPDAHSGEDLVIFFKTNVAELATANQAIEFCKELSEELAVLRLIGEIGNKFIATHDAYYVWKPEAFSLHTIKPDPSIEDIITPLPERRHPRAVSPTSISSSHHKRASLTSNSPRASIITPSLANPHNGDTAGQRASGGGFAKYLQTAVSQAAKGINDLSVTVGVTNPPIFIDPSGETREERLRREAESAAKTYATFVGRLDHTRLMLEQTISEHATFLQRCELDRLRAAKAVIMGFNAALASLIPKLTRTADESGVLHESFSPDSDVAALVERYRTGPFRPSPIVFHSCKGYMPQVNFGIDLSKWHNSQNATDTDVLYDVPPILTHLLTILEKKYPTIESHSERRKTWIYEVPLRAVHSLRDALNNPGRDLISEESLVKLDAPLIAATVKLWLLELDPSPVHSSRYDDVKAIYPQLAGMETPSVDARVDVLAVLLSKLPKPHLMVIDAVASHLSKLIESTETDEKAEIFLTKLGLSTAKCLLRPKIETAVTLSDRFQPLFLADLINYYDRILPQAITLRNQMLERERNKPQRKHTRPVDMRVRRSVLGIEGSIPDEQAQEILETHRRRVSGTGMVFVPPSLTDTATPGESVEGSEIKTPKAMADAEYFSPTEQVIDYLPMGPEENPVIASDDQSRREADAESGYHLSTEHTPAVPAIPEQEFEEGRDRPFIPPSTGDDGDPVDAPFTPPMTDSTAHSGLASRVLQPALDEDDIPLTSKASISRWGSGTAGKNPSPRASNRTRGVVSSRPGSRATGSRPSSISTANSSAPPTGGASPHKKGSPSFDSIRSQFESKRKSGNGSIDATAGEQVSTNRYRRLGGAMGSGKPIGGMAGAVSEVPDHE